MSVQQKIKIAVDGVVFGYDSKNGVSVLLIKRKYDPFKSSWAIPGGFVLNGESLEEAVERELKEETGINVNYAEQLFTFGKPDRDPRQQIVSVAYLALVRPSSFQLQATTDATDAQWHPIKKLPKLAFDHKEILKMAVARLKNKVIYEPIGFELLDEKFPFSELERLYVTLLDRDIDRRNFKKKVMSYGILEELDEYAPSTGPGRPGKLYRFIKTKYNALKKEGVYFEI
jgi:8-oxo-dGTP diphosphatase